MTIVQTVSRGVERRIERSIGTVVSMMDWVLEPIQRRVGVNRMAYFFVLPNLLIFGVFILLPMLLNFYYAFTGGTKLFPQVKATLTIAAFVNGGAPPVLAGTDPTGTTTTTTTATTAPAPTPAPSGATAAGATP